MRFNRSLYFDYVRDALFAGSLTQEQVDGQEAILARWEADPASDDLRHLAYPLATTFHETGQRMAPIEEIGKGEGHNYGKQDPQTKQTYYGRGFVQLTHRDNYARATKELGLKGDDDLEWHAERALDCAIAADTMFHGMWDGWFRSGETLTRYFDVDADDPYGAREIINGDKHVVPSWSHGVSIGTLIAGYHQKFLAALELSVIWGAEPAQPDELVVTVSAPPGVRVVVRTES